MHGLCVRRCDRCGKTRCRRTITQLGCWSPQHGIGKAQVFLASGLFPVPGAGSAAPRSALYPCTTILPVPAHIPASRTQPLQHRLRERTRNLLQTNNGAVFTFPFNIPFGLFCFFIFIVFLHLHSRATRDTSGMYSALCFYDFCFCEKYLHIQIYTQARL